jgi:aminoglycoside phosphotransferase family enzyme
MTKNEINSLLANGAFPEPAGQRELIETHISWVILCGQFVYKIKKPIHYSFLDFSTLALRKHFCEREVALNKRLTDNIYLDVLPIREWQNRIIIGSNEGKIIEYAVRMNKQDKEKQMDALLLKNEVTETDIRNLAEKIAFFHKHTDIIKKANFLDVQEKFNDLESEKEYVSDQLGKDCSNIIAHSIETSDTFIAKNKELLASRLKAGFFRDCHGDLHSRNIFLLPSPQPFDCIEFNDDLRQIDVLNEVAFLCMDLDAFGRQDLSAVFIDQYNKLLPAMVTDQEKSLFIYYKSYRANIRAKVNSLRAKTAVDSQERNKALSATDKYLHLMDTYIQALDAMSS